MTTHLMFTGQAEEAMAFYTDLFDGEVLEIERHGPDGEGEEGTVMWARFRLLDQELRCIDSPPVHDFGFTPALSLYVECADQAEQDRLFGALSEGGQVLMPLDSYDRDHSTRFGWVNDRFGVSWQLNLP